MEVERGLDDVACFGLGGVGGLATVDADEFRQRVAGDPWRGPVLEEGDKVGVVEVVGPFGDAHFVPGETRVEEAEVVEGTQAVDGDQLIAVLRSRKPGERAWRGQGRIEVGDGTEAVKLDGRHCKINMAADVHWEMVLIASEAEATSLLVLEEMVLCVE